MRPTHENEITEPVNLCLPGGKFLNPAARGWSRTPLHTGNLAGGWGRTKKWDYWGVLSERFALSVTYADVDYLGMASIHWIDLTEGISGGREVPLPGARGVTLPDLPGSAPLIHSGSHSRVVISDDPTGTTIDATWIERDGRPGRIAVHVALPDGHESLNVVIPWSDKQFQYTSKHQARPVTGMFSVGDMTATFGSGDGELEGWGVLDVGRGRWPYATRWNWGGGAGHATSGAVIGVQIGAKWTEGTGYTENGVIVDGRLTKIGEELTWDYDWDDPMKPWHVHDAARDFDLTLTPVHDKHSKANAFVLRTEVHQVFGTWTGHITDDTGTRHDVDGIVGFAEESRSRW